jgi:hydrogenase/urease accessory protein HupE
VLGDPGGEFVPVSYGTIPTVKRVVFAALAFVALLMPAPAAAHPVPFTYLDVHVESGALTLTLVAHIADLANDLKIEPVENLLKPEVVNPRVAMMTTMLTPRFTIAVDGRPLTPIWSPTAEILAERQSLRFTLRYELVSPPGTLIVRALMFPYDPNHQTFLNVYEGERLTQAILDRGRPSFEYFSATRQGVWAVVRRFVPAGVNHILIGPDHLLFLVGLLLLGGTARQLVLIVSSFTLAHTLTLSLAALNIVSSPARIIEPAIALSIVYVGADNLLARGGRDMRTWIAFAFGFIHGLGYANLLREMDLQTRALEWSLFSFNAGLEIGQLIVVMAVASLLGAIRSRNERAGHQVVFAGSLVVIAAGTFWFIKRVFFPA